MKLRARTKTKPYEKVIDHIMQGSNHLSGNRPSQAASHFRHARRYANDHVSVLHALGNHSEVKDFEKDFNDLMDIKEGQLHEKTKIQKSESVPFKETNNIYMFDEFKKSQNDYKWLHELHPDDLANIVGRTGRPKYSGSMHHAYLYPTDQEGRLVHSARKEVIPSNENTHQRLLASRANMKEINKPSFKEGQGIKITGINHPNHGSFGVIRPPSSEEPGKLRVQLPSGSHVSLNTEDVSVSKENKNISKSIIILDEIRKRKK